MAIPFGARELFIALGGVAATVLIQHGIRRWSASMTRRLTLLGQFWLFLAPFACAVAAAYWFALSQVDPAVRQNYVSIVGPVATLVFAAFVGRLSFAHILETRMEKFHESGKEHVKANQLLRAREDYETAVACCPSAFVPIAELMEVYLALGDYDKFDDHLPHLEATLVEARERTVAAILRTVRFLLVQDLGKAKVAIRAALESIRTGKSSIPSGWKLTELRASKGYQSLGKEAKAIFDNVEQFFAGKLPDDKKRAFESGDYSLI